MDNLIVILLVLMLMMAVFIAVILLRRQNTSPEAGLQAGEIKGQLEQISQMAGMLQAQVTAQLQNQERSLNETLRKQAETTSQKLGDLQSRLAVIDKAHASLTELSAQTTRLENVLSNKQARGAYGEMQLENLVRQVLPPNAYKFQGKLSNGSRPDCLLLLPNPPGPIVIDAKFPLEAWYELGEAEDDMTRLVARKKLAAALATHVDAIAGKYIITGETAESAMLFLPSEAVYAEFHTHHPKVLEDSFKKRVYLTSPTTLMATLNTVRAILRDVKMREQATVIQAEVARLLEDITRLDKRVGNLSQHFALAQKDINEITTSTRKITQRSEAIERIEVEENASSTPTPKAQPNLLD
ncbi:MAG: DNA recombination protein RmuC [Alphaproteobacteria bacterium]|nr:DNA recombination protein RmuC [Alphaproteobacteria bacterium]